jgi:membrane protein
MKIRGIDLLDAGKRMFHQVREDQLTDRAAVVAYQFLFSVVPLMIFLTALSAFVSKAIGTEDAVSNVTNWLFNHLPDTTAEAVKQPIQEILQNQSGGLLSFGAVLALWSAKGAVAAMMKGLNIAYDVEDTRSWPRRTAIAIGLTVALGIALIVSSIILVVGFAAGQRVQNAVGIGDVWSVVWQVARWPLIAVFLLVALAFLYWAGPNIHLPIRWLSPGAVLSVVGWAIATYGLGIYFKYAGSYAAAYGVLGGVLAFIFWIYVLSLIVLIGGELNAVIRAMGTNGAEAPGAHASDPSSTEERQQHPVGA